MLEIHFFLHFVHRFVFQMVIARIFVTYSNNNKVLRSLTFKSLDRCIRREQDFRTNFNTRIDVQM